MENNITENSKHYYCLILAGGKGRRLWPASRESLPKQFIDFFGTGKSLLQQTYERYLQFLPKENIYVSTYVEYKDKVAEQLPELDESQLLCEPIRRNTAPIVAWVTHRLECIDPDAVLVVSPSDQLITNDNAFITDVVDGMCHSLGHRCLLTMGVRPSRPEPGYGYLQLGDELETTYGSGFFNVQSFTEKPERDFAEMFIKSGEFLWNTGIYIASVRTIHETLAEILPAVMRSLDETHTGASWQQETEWVNEHYSLYPNLSLESGILERYENICIKECKFGWADIGAWHGIYEALATSEGDNVVLNSDSMLSDTTGCVISLPSGRKAVINDLHNYIVVENNDILLITPRSDSSSTIVKLQNKYYNS